MQIKIRAIIATALFAVAITSAHAQATRDLIEPNIMTSPKPAAETKVPSLDGIKAAPPATTDIMVQPTVEPPKAAAQAEPPKAAPPASAAVTPATKSEPALSDMEKIARSISSLQSSVDAIYKGQLNTTADLGALNKRLDAFEQASKAPSVTPPPATADIAASQADPKAPPVPKKDDEVVVVAPPAPPAVAGMHPLDELPEGWVVNRSKVRM